MISIDSLSKSFGASVLFQNASFKINRRERVGLVGRNGHGKTTLFRILSGQEDADSGNLAIPKNYRIGYVKQEMNFTENTVLEEGKKGLPEDVASLYWKVEKILFGLGFDDEDLKRSPKDLSGGFQVRLNLTKELLSEPDLLLLDEPTNYLDITSIRWIKGFLNQWPREVFIITHDRGFMDSIVTHVLGIHRQKVRKISGNTEKYYMQIAQEEEIHEKTRINEDKRRKEIEVFVTRFRAKARLAGMVQSRVKTLSKLTPSEKLEKFKNLDFSFRSKLFSGKILGRIEDLAFGYIPSYQLISDFNLTIGPTDRICVIGRNGAGKTTLLKLLGGVMSPDKGRIDYHHDITPGYFEQTNVKTLDGDKSIEDEILYTSPDLDRQAARNICGAMLFEGDSALKKIAVLSGGEKSRVMLGKLLCKPINLLLLDEPSNHFDMESCDALLSAIDQFNGAVVMVTHNEMFLHAIADRLIVFKDDTVSVFEGDYQQFLNIDGWGDNITPDLSVKNEADCSKPDKLTKREIRRLRSAIIVERGKVLKSLERKIDELERIIDANEIYLQELNGNMQSATEKNDGRLITDLSQKLHQCQFEIDRDFEEFEVLSVSVESKRSAFDLKLLELDEAGC
ncbi:MAG: ABC-F family ATP-binding cassette domain-containing protein [Desulfobacteraceae bacterium]|nr:ABC-F family ATP-binding cassette domain-containing protein [Desulfobacteraceae bacterium]